MRGRARSTLTRDRRLSISAMVNLIAVLLVPVAVILTDTIGGGSPFAEYNEGRAAWVNFGTCFFGVILTSLFGLPLILYHITKLTGLGLGLWLASTVVTFTASVSALRGATSVKAPFTTHAPCRRRFGTG